MRREQHTKKFRDDIPRKTIKRKTEIETKRCGNSRHEDIKCGGKVDIK
jgi:hypothetical protein